MLIINKEEGWIGYRLNILGVRVWSDSTCQLVAKSGGEWRTMGPARGLPVAVPTNAAELLSAVNDPLLLTAYQYMAEYPESDLAGLLSKRMDFETVLDSKCH